MTTSREELIAKTTKVQYAAKVVRDFVWPYSGTLVQEVLRVMRGTRVDDDELPPFFAQTKRNFNTVVDSELFRRQIGSKAIHGLLKEADVVDGVQPEFHVLVKSLAATLDVRFSNCLHSFLRYLRVRLQDQTEEELMRVGVSPGQLCQGLWECLRHAVCIASRHERSPKDKGGTDVLYHVATEFQKAAIHLIPARSTLPATYFAAGHNEQGVGLHAACSDVLLQNHELSLLFSLVHYGSVVDKLLDECDSDRHAIPLVETHLYQHAVRCSLELFAMLDPTRAIVELVQASRPQPDACVDAEHEVLPHGADVFVDGLQRHLFERLDGNHVLCAAAQVFQTPERAMRQYNRAREDEALQANVALVKEEWQGFSTRVFSAFEAAVHSSHKGAESSVVLLLWKSHALFDLKNLMAETAGQALHVKSLLLEPSWEGRINDAAESLQKAARVTRLLQCVYAACKRPSLVGENPESHSFPGLLLRTSLLLQSLEAAKAAFTDYRGFVRSTCQDSAQPQPGAAPRTAALTAFLSRQEMADFLQRMTGNDTDGDQTLFSVIRREVELLQMIGIRPLRRNLLLLVDLCMLRCFIHPHDGCGGARLAYSDCLDGFACPDVYAPASSAGSSYHRSRVAALLYREFSAKLYDLHDQQSLANTSLAALPEQLRTSADLLCGSETGGSAADAPILPLLDVFCRTDGELKETLDRLGSALAATRVADASAATRPSSCPPQRQAAFAEGTHLAFQTPTGECAEGTVCGVLRRAVPPRSDGVPQPSPALYSYIVRSSSPQRRTTVVSELSVVSSRERDAHVPSQQTALFTPTGLHAAAVSARPPATALRAGHGADPLHLPAGPRGTCRSFDSDAAAAAKKRRLAAGAYTPPAQWDLEDWEPVALSGASTSGTPPSTPVERRERELQEASRAEELSPREAASDSVLPDTSTPSMPPAKPTAPEWQPTPPVAAPSPTAESLLDSQQALVAPRTPPAHVLSNDTWRNKYEAARAKHMSEQTKHKKLLAFATAKWGERAALLDKVLVLQLGYEKVAADLQRLGRVVPGRSDLVAALHAAAPLGFLSYATPVHVQGSISQTAWQEKYAEAKAMFKCERARHKELHAKVCLVQHHLSQLTEEESALVRATIANKKLYDRVVE